VRSAIRYVGCFPTPFGTNGWAGSWVTGPGSTPGIDSKNGPPPLSPTQPALFDEKSGGEALSWAAAGAADAPDAIPTRMLPARTFALKEKENILHVLPQCCSVGIAGARHALLLCPVSIHPLRGHQKRLAEGVAPPRCQGLGAVVRAREKRQAVVGGGAAWVKLPFTCRAARRQPSPHLPRYCTGEKRAASGRPAKWP